MAKILRSETSIKFYFLLLIKIEKKLYKTVRTSFINFKIWCINILPYVYALYRINSRHKNIETNKLTFIDETSRTFCGECLSQSIHKKSECNYENAAFLQEWPPLHLAWWRLHRWPWGLIYPHQKCVPNEVVTITITGFS